MYFLSRKSINGLYPIQEGVGIIISASMILNIMNKRVFVPGPTTILSWSISRLKYLLLNPEILSLSFSMPAESE